MLNTFGLKGNLVIERFVSYTYGTSKYYFQIYNGITLTHIRSQLSRQLDVAPAFVEHPTMGMFGLEKHLVSRNALQVPHPFTERALQTELCRFWRSFDHTSYDLVEAEERYERFTLEFLANLPPAFSLYPDLRYDDYCPKLALQRKTFHIAVYESICSNFRPVMGAKWEDKQHLPPYKRVLLHSQKTLLATVALKLATTVGEFYCLLGAKYTRSVNIVFYTFEAAVLLGCLCLDLDLPEYFQRPVGIMDLAENDGAVISKQMCVQHIKTALARLEVLAEVSVMAEAGAQSLSKLLDRVQISIAMPEDGNVTYMAEDAACSFLDVTDLDFTLRSPLETPVDDDFSPITLEDMTSNEGISELEYTHSLASL
jgi:hypothetical protein